jgi:hypothetical protein
MAALFDVARRAKDVTFFRELADQLLHLDHNDWTEWEWDWLAAMASKPDSYGPSDKEREKLAQIHSYSELCAGHDGLTVEAMLRSCHSCHLEFLEEDSDFIVELYQRNARVVRRRQLRRLVRLYAQAGEDVATAWVEEPA